ncbi:hypothetical protein ACIBK8_31000 [Streptomyces sp. NPDC050161]|uniref:hypothetical protein n=1 Tax=Streptomyces sp. NPDC050161 TaxID=3365604 RepID=UPI00379F9217
MNVPEDARTTGSRPEVGDEVEYLPGLHAIVTDIREGTLYLRAGPREWPVENTGALRVKRPRAQRIAERDIW